MVKDEFDLISVLNLSRSKHGEFFFLIEIDDPGGNLISLESANHCLLCFKLNDAHLGDVTSGQMKVSAMAKIAPKKIQSTSQKISSRRLKLSKSTLLFRGLFSNWYLSQRYT